MANKKVNIQLITGKPVVKPAKRPNHLKVKQGDVVSWHNDLNSIVLLILNSDPNDPRDIRRIFAPPRPNLLTVIPPHGDSPKYTVTTVPNRMKGLYTYKVYVVNTDRYAEGGSEPELEVL